MSSEKHIFNTFFAKISNNRTPKFDLCTSLRAHNKSEQNEQSYTFIHPYTLKFFTKPKREYEQAYKEYTAQITRKKQQQQQA